MRTAPKAGHMTAADQIVTASKKSLDPRAPSTHEHLGEGVSALLPSSVAVNPMAVARERTKRTRPARAGQVFGGRNLRRGR